MRYAVVSDIHSNLEALSAVARAIREHKPEKIICLGDIVGYNADPSECISWVRKNAATVIRGNHDKAVVGLLNPRYFNDYAREAVEWTAKSISGEEKAWIKALTQGPVSIDERIVICHGTPQDEDMYMESPNVAADSFGFLEDSFHQCSVCFFGHTHVPLVIDDESGVFMGERTVKLKKKRRYLVNPGAIGQPRDGNPNAGFCVYDDEEQTVTLVRVPYAVEETQQKILLKGLPEVLSSRLSVGR